MPPGNNGARMARIRLICADLICGHPPGPRHPRTIPALLSLLPESFPCFMHLLRSGRRPHPSHSAASTGGKKGRKEIRADIERAVDASPSLRNKKDLIEQFVDSVSTQGKVDAQWLAFVEARKAAELDQIIADEGLKAEETKVFVDNAFRDGAIPTAGTAITKILPPVSRFAKDNGHAVKKQTVLEKQAAFFERYFGLG